MKTILLIDDNQDFRETVREMLEREGYSVIEAEDGGQGIKLYRSHAIDLVITDIIMPNKEGVETIFELHFGYPNVKIIAISGGGHLSASDHLSALEDVGVSYTFTKPLNRDEFLAAIEKTLT